jgi:hypothetical protein
MTDQMTLLPRSRAPIKQNIVEEADNTEAQLHAGDCGRADVEAANTDRLATTVGSTWS